MTEKKKINRKRRGIQASVLASCMALLIVGLVSLYRASNADAMTRVAEKTSKTFYSSSANKMFIIITGPSGTSKLQITASWGGNTNTTASTFRGSPRKVKLTGKIVSSSNPYGVSFTTNTYKTVKADSGNYVNISFPVKYNKPAHQQGNGTQWDVPDGTAKTHNFASVNDHATSAETKTIDLTVSLYNFGIITYDNKKSNGNWEHLRFYNTSATFNLHYYESRPLSFDSCGGSAVASRTAKDNTYFTNLPNPTNTGYTFAGWYDKSSGGTRYTSVLACKDGLKKLYAHWTANQYTITYNGNGATSGSMAAGKATYGSNYTLAANTFKKTYYVFSGWATSAKGTKVYNDKGTFQPFKGTSNLTLYAVWTPANYKVTIKFNGNGGTCNAADKSVTVLSQITLPSSEVTREGYRLVGWTLNKEDKENYEQPGASIKADSDMTYYALWESTMGNSNLSNVITDTDMFKGDEQLQGSDGTEYNSVNIDSSYAHPDGGADDPGYFTER